MSECLCLQGKPCICPCHRTDTAATPTPDDTLREMARTITAHVRLGGTTRCSCGEIWQPLHVAEALREHVAAAVQAERERVSASMTGDPTRDDTLREQLAWAMRGTTDGDLIDPDSEIPIGEAERLAYEFIRDHVAAAVQAERAAQLARWLEGESP